MKPEISVDIKSFSQYEKWRQVLGKSEISWWDYLKYTGDFESAVVFGKLFWPDFVEIEGHIFLSGRYSEQLFRKWQKELKDKIQVEQMINHIHIYDLFPDSTSENMSKAVFEFIGQLLLKTWNYALRETFPDRQFKMYYASEPEEYGPTISFSQLIDRQ